MTRILYLRRKDGRGLAAICALVLAACTNGAQTSAVTSSVPSLPAPSASPSALVPPAAPIPGKIAFSTQRGDIWVMNADGTHRRRLTHPGSAFHFDPSWSPDARQIVFRISSDTDPVPDPDSIGLDSIGVVDVASRRVTRIQPPQGGLFPDWSPLGNLILLSTVKGGLHAFDGLRHPVDTVHTIKPDGSNLTTLSSRIGECGEWSPDATRILYCSHRGDGDFETWVMNADGSDARQLTSSQGTNDGALWSPDGRRIAFTSERDGQHDLWVMNADGSGEHPVLHWPDTGESPGAWLPQGIVFASFVPDAPLPSWFIVQPDGTHLRSLPQLEGAADPMDWIQP